jgi:hypothetical protein
VASSLRRTCDSQPVSWAELSTLVVACGTAALALVTFWQVGLSRSSLELSTRPFLADPSPDTSALGHDDLLFGAPGRISVKVQRGELFYRADESGAFYLSISLENIGAGVAAIVGAEIDPSVVGDIYVSRRFVPVGGHLRINVAVLTEIEGAERFKEFWWAMGGVSVIVRYTDAKGEQPMRTQARIIQAATRSPFVDEIAVFRDRKWRKPKPVAVGRGSY